MENSIKQLREQMGISQSDLGSSVDVSRQTINSIENGKFEVCHITCSKFFQQITLINRRN